jgi:hypothetical protein
MHYSIISPQMNDIGAQSPTNEHTERLAEILLTYNFYEKELGSYLVLLCMVHIIHCLLTKVTKVMFRGCRICVLRYMSCWVRTTK